MKWSKNIALYSDALRKIDNIGTRGIVNVASHGAYASQTRARRAACQARSVKARLGME